MGTVLFNPSNEDMHAQYVGEAVIIKAESKIKVDDPRGRHVLNEFGQRGLCKLDYGDDEEVVGAEGLRRNREFKLRQVMLYNQMNEARRQQNQAYMAVPKQIEGYADELGVGVIMPYNIKDGEREELAKLRTERDEQKKELLEMKVLMQRLLDQKDGGDAVNPDETLQEKKVAMNRMMYKRLAPNTLKGWIRNNKLEIAAWPEENLSELRKKYAEFYKKELDI